jgi:hypothetical protein
MDKLPIFPILRASTKAEVEAAKQKLVEGLKASAPHLRLCDCSNQMSTCILPQHLQSWRGYVSWLLLMLQYLERFLQKYALPGEPGYFLGSEYSYAETVSRVCEDGLC